ncbi:MAG: prefoldin subunit alpha [Thermoplasmata archaeon]|uniref:Prefoldin subunit alpha n=1 Tax=Candidatus Sysuiplasma superficiale TaxID=2823368 RepID=A0A8J7YSN7_9ARCH|nr:prefoldin subunit alpha [Candidatus Sysuiplasma superficiale]MBX8643367.1 prefoldin subunit alpha [Candidatus Sysuiplasma superficiale]MCL4347101.1 prefoldin subunit alpha [Candidatus Thermoplasmatota archaeon]
MNEDEFRQALAALENLKAQAENLSAQLQLIQDTINEFSRAKETASNYSRVEDGAEVMVPVGGGVFLPARAVKTGRGVMSTGVGYSFEQSLSRIVETMDTRIKELVEASQKIYDRMSELQRQINSLQSVIEEEATREQGPQQG